LELENPELEENPFSASFVNNLTCYSLIEDLGFEWLEGVPAF
jgi:hypothetical protein